MNKLVMMTGGGTAGHVMPNLALAEPLQVKGYRIGYIGRKNSIEERLVKEAGIAFYPISAGRLHRDFNMENWITPWKNLKGTVQAAAILRREKPSVVFCKGGFVSVPVAVAAHLAGIPVVLHESDITPGLANRLCLPFADMVCVSFEETLPHISAGRDRKTKVVLTGTPIREELTRGSRSQGFAMTGLSPGKPVVLVMGGSSGARALNQVVGMAAAKLTRHYQVVHLCGRQDAAKCKPRPGYFPMEYAGPELAHLYAMADLVVSRAGANALAEILLLEKPNVLIPLPRAVSRGDQILNARSFEKKGYSYVLPQEELTEESLQMALAAVWQSREKYAAALSSCNTGGQNGVRAVLRAIESTMNKS